MSARKKAAEEGRRKTAYIKSNNPHLTGGEIGILLCLSYLKRPDVKEVPCEMG